MLYAYVLLNEIKGIKGIFKSFSKSEASVLLVKYKTVCTCVPSYL